MKRRIIIDKDYNFLSNYIEDIPVKFDFLGEILHADRNIIRADHIANTKVVIKSFRRIYLPNRIRYTYFYPSKAQRAFDYAKILLEKGFHTPKPIAYIEITKNGLLVQSYFVSEYTDFQPLKTILEMPFSEQKELLAAFANHTYRLHQSNIYHGDYSLGNILYKKVNGCYEFSLVDNNRMKFGNPNFKRGVKNLVRLGLQEDHLAFIGKEYARLWDVNETMALERLYYYRKNQLQKRSLKRYAKKIISNLNRTRE